MFFSNYIPNKLITTEIKNKIKKRDIFYQQLKKWKLNLTVHKKSHTCEEGGHTSEFLFATYWWSRKTNSYKKNC